MKLVASSTKVLTRWTTNLSYMNSINQIELFSTKISKRKIDNKQWKPVQNIDMIK